MEKFSREIGGHFRQHLRPSVLAIHYRKLLKEQIASFLSNPQYFPCQEITLYHIHTNFMVILLVSIHL